MPPPSSPELRDELQTLRIDRSAPAPKRGLPRGVVALGAALALALAGALVLRERTRPLAVEIVHAERSDPAAAAASGPVLSGSGYVVTGDKYISIGVRVAGRIDEYLVDESDRVEAGQPLVRLDARDYEAALARAEAGLRRAEAQAVLERREMERQRQLHRAEIAPIAELELAQSQLAVAEAAVAELQAEIVQARVNLDYTVLRAPTAGVILAKLKEVGEMAVPGGFAGSGDLIRMANLDDLRAEVDVNETDLARVRLGQAAQVVPDAYPDARYAATVVKLYPQMNRQKGTLKLEAQILEPDEKLRPDMSVRVHFLAEAAPEREGEALVLAPRSALREEAGAAYAWVLSQGRLRRQPLTLGTEVGERVVVATGLLGGEALVVGEVEGLREGRRAEARAADKAP